MSNVPEKMLSSDSSWASHFTLHFLEKVDEKRSNDRFCCDDSSVPHRILVLGAVKSECWVLYLYLTFVILRSFICLGWHETN